MKTIRCYYTDFWSTDIEEIVPISLLKDNYNIVLDDKNPDYLFYSCFGNEHLKYNRCIKIYWGGENVEPDFNCCDYSISFSVNNYGDRTFRQQLNICIHSLSEPLAPDQLLNRKFCNFIYSNSVCADPFRIRFFNELSKYKKIDSGGPLLNNLGYQIPVGCDNKIQFQRQYKFTLAIENSSYPGYTTEKIVHPFMAHSLPIYWGDPHISRDYRADSFVNLMDYASIEEAIEEIIRLDTDDEAYLQKVTSPFWLAGNSFEDFQQQEKLRLQSFLDHIFEQPLKSALRRTFYGRMGFILFPKPTRSLTDRVKNKISRTMTGLSTK